jgi:hypothetical protein
MQRMQQTADWALPSCACLQTRSLQPLYLYAAAVAAAGLLHQQQLLSLLQYLAAGAYR